MKKHTQYLGNKVTRQIDFDPAGTFAAFRTAEGWLNDNGYSSGSMCGQLPIAIKWGNFLVAKWKNLTKSEQKNVDGVMISSDFREGGVTVLLFDEQVYTNCEGCGGDIDEGKLCLGCSYGQDR